MTLDLVIRNGTVVDGSGAPARRADVAVRGDRVVAIGAVDESARETIDAEGHVVSPGFVDGHTHMDAQVFWDELGTNTCWHGVTSVVMGNCGFTLAPARPAERHLVTRNLERAEDISAASMEAGLPWTWATFPEYMDAVDALPKGLNYVANVGHSCLRTWAMGERAFSEEASDADLEVMLRELDGALAAGAFGLSSSRSVNHATADDRPVASRVASWAEVRALVDRVGRHRAVFQVSAEPAQQSDDPAVRGDYLYRMRSLALDAGVTVITATMPNSGGWSLLQLMEEVSKAGGRMFGLSHSRGVGVVTSFSTRLAYDQLADWKSIRALPLAEQRRHFDDPVTRARLVEAAKRADFRTVIGTEVPPPDYGRMHILRDPARRNPTVLEEATAKGVHPVELVIQLGLETNFEQFFLQPITNTDPDAMLRLLQHPNTVMSFADSGAHVSQICDSSIYSYLLSHWVRERQVLTIEDAVHMITGAPAAAWGLVDRGRLVEGAFADITIFDPERVAPDKPTIARDLPGGGMRLVQTATGFAASIVNGQVLIRNGQPTGNLPGRLLRRS